MSPTPDHPPAPPASPSLAAPAVASEPAASGGSRGFELPFDPWRLIAATLRKWYWILLCGALLAAAGGGAGYLKFEPLFTASAQLMRQEPAGTFRASELGEPFKPRQLSVTTLVSFMKSIAVLQRVSEQSQPRLSPRAILGGLTITPERNTDLITITYKSARSASAAMGILNLFGAEVVRLTRDMQGQEAAEVNRLLRKQLTKTEGELQQINTELLAFSQNSGLVNVDKEMDAALRKLGELDLRFETARIDHETLDLKITALEQELARSNPLAERVQMARESLAALRTEFTDANPLVQEQLERVAAIEKELEAATGKPIAPPRQGESSLAASFYQELVSLKTQKEVMAAQLDKLKAARAAVDDRLRLLPEKGMQYARIKARQQSLETAQALLASRQREAQLYEESPLGYYRFFESRPDQVDVAGRGKKVLMLGVAGGFAGASLCLALVCLVESLDDRLKTVADAKRVTRLPVLARLPDLASLDAVGQANWAFRTWMAMQAKLTAAPDRGLVCGFAATSSGEGCSTWLDLLGCAAGQRGQQVLVITNSPPRNGTTLGFEEALDAPAQVRVAVGSPTWLLLPASWSWDAPRRRQWQVALKAWRQTPGLVVLMELTAVEQPESLLLAESLPQLVWLVGSGQVAAGPTAERLDVLRHAGCRFAGVVVNRYRPLFPWIPINL